MGMRFGPRQDITARMSIRSTGEKVAVIIEDSDAGTEIMTILITPSDFTSMLGGLASVPCHATVSDLNKIGKTMEYKELVFQMPDGIGENSSWAEQRAIGEADDGWIPDLGFSSQGSFFTKDGIPYARTTQRRWV